MDRVVRLPVTVLALACALAAPVHAEPGSGLAMRDLIVEGIHHNFAGDFDAADRVWQRLRVREPGHPAPAVFEVSTLYWRQMWDEDDTRHDAAIERTSREAIRLAEARLAAGDTDAETHYYLGQALFDLARLEGIRGRFFAAGTHGEQARGHLERALALEPSLVDARCPLGMYYYYAGLLPGLVKWLGWLWFVPTGEAATGRRFLEEVYQRGDVHRLDAAFVLMNIHTYHEPDQRGLALAQELHAAFPQNPMLHYELLEALFDAERYSEVVDGALVLEGHPRRYAMDEALGRMARGMRARAELYRGRPEEAFDLLEAFGAEGPPRPSWGTAWVWLTRAQARDAVGARSEAIALYERVAALEPPRRSSRAAALARSGLDTPFVPPRASLRAAEP